MIWGTQWPNVLYQSRKGLSWIFLSFGNCTKFLHFVSFGVAGGGKHLCFPPWEFLVFLPSCTLAHTSRVWIKHIRSVDGASRTFAELGRFGISLIVTAPSLLCPISCLNRRHILEGIWLSVIWAAVQCWLSPFIVFSRAQTASKINGKFLLLPLAKVLHTCLWWAGCRAGMGVHPLCYSPFSWIWLQSSASPKIKATEFSANYFIASKLTSCDLCVFLMLLKFLYYISHKPQWLMLILSL